MLRAIIAIFSSAALVQFCAASEIVGLINRGDIDEARRQLEQSSSVSHRDGTLLYARALLESDGQRSLQFLEAAEKSGVSAEYEEDIADLKILFNFANGDYRSVIAMSESYFKRWENGRYRPEILRMAAIAYEHEGKSERVTRLQNQLSKENPEDESGQIGKLDRANELYHAKKYGEALKIYQKLADSKHDAISAPAIFMTAHCALEENHVDDAIFRYNLLKEAYPDAVGLDDLMDDLSRLEKKSEDLQAEKITGTSYAIQAGVFSDKNNAKNLVKRLKQYGEPVELGEKTISGKDYYVVYVGKFQSAEKAMAFKARLEISEKEAFQVVAR